MVTQFPSDFELFKRKSWCPSLRLQELCNVEKQYYGFLHIGLSSKNSQLLKSRLNLHQRLSMEGAASSFLRQEILGFVRFKRID